MSPVPVPLPNLTPSERATYERAVRLWKHAASLVKAERSIRPTLGATVFHGKRWGACLIFLALVACGVSPTEPNARVANAAAPAPTPTPGPSAATCPPGSTYDVPSRSCTTPARCPPGYEWELYVGCSWPGFGPEPTPVPGT